MNDKSKPDPNSSNPGKVETEEALRPSDEHVVTSDLPVQTEDDTEDKGKSPKDPDKDSTAAASTDNSEQDSNDQNSAADDKKTDTSDKRRTRGNRANRRLKKQISEQQKRIDALEARLNSGSNSAPTPQAEPQLDDFKSPREYAKAYTEWEKSQADDKANTPNKSPADDTRSNSDQPTPEELEEVKNFYEAGVKKYGDEYSEAVTDPDLRIDKNMAEFMFDSKHGHEIMMHLANNPDESVDIYEASERRQLRALSALEDKAKSGKLDVGADDLTLKPGKKENKSSEKQPSGSDRFKPPSNTRDTNTPSSQSKDPENMDMDDYAAKRRAQMKEQGIR